MNVYIIELNDDCMRGKAIIAANNYGEAGRIFNDKYERDYGIDNPIVQWKCCICLTDKLFTTCDTPQIIIDAVIAVL